MVRPAIGISAIEPYKASPGAVMSLEEKRQYLKLDWNESAFPPSPLVHERLEGAIRTGGLNFYPDITASELREKLEAYTEVSADCIRVYNGSDAALRDICTAYLDPGDNVIIKEPTYTQFHKYVLAVGANPLPMLGRTPFDPATIALSILLASVQTRLVYIVNPNNPTGVLYTTGDLKSLVASCPETLFVIDEAYYEYTNITIAPLVNRFNNLIVTRSFSKAFSLAGLRVAYTLAAPIITAALDKIRNGKEVNVLGQIAAVAALDSKQSMRWTVQKTMANKAWTLSQLTELEIFDTPANFFLLKVNDVPKTLRAFRDRGILLRDRSQLPQMEGFIRVTIGTREQMEQFVEVAREVLIENLESWYRKEA